MSQRSHPPRLEPGEYWVETADQADATHVVTRHRYPHFLGAAAVGAKDLDRAEDAGEVLVNVTAWTGVTRVVLVRWETRTIFTGEEVP